MWDLLFSKPLPLMALFLTSQQVLLGLGLVSLCVAAYIFYRKRSYHADGEKMLKKTGLNGSVGFIAALAIVLIAMSWTTREQLRDWVSGDLQSAILEDLPPVTLGELPPPPPTPVEPPKLESPEMDLTEKPEPAPDPEKKKSPEGTKEGTGKEITGSKGPILPPAPPKIDPLVAPKTQTVKLKVEDYAEHMPYFADQRCENSGNSWDIKKSCGDQALLIYLSKTVKYPLMAREQHFEGTVYIRFVVELDGSISNIEVLRDQTPGGGLKQAAIQAIQKMAKEQKFVPGEMNGRPVRVRMVVPIKFTLRK